MASNTKSGGGAAALLYVAFFAAVAGPTIVLVLLGLLGPEPYVIVEESFDRYRDKARLRQEAEVETHAYDDPASARAAADRYADGVAKSGASKTLHERRYVRDDNGHYELVAPIGSVLLRIEGRDKSHVDAVLADLPFVAENPERNVAWVLVTDYLAELLVGIGLYVVLLLVVFSRLASRVARVKPSPGVTRLSRDEVRERLLALDELDLPFSVTELPRGRLSFEWRILDESWSGRMRDGGLRLRHRVVLDLDGAKGVARAIQTTTRASWSKTPWKGDFGFAWSRSLLAYEAGAATGVALEEGGWRLDERYRYRFVPTEIVKPVAAAILDAGWEFRPVYTFFRPLGG